MACLKLRVKDINQTAPHVEVLQRMPRNCTASKLVSWAQSVFIGQMVVKMCGISDSHGPQGGINAIGPMYRSMKNVGMCHVRHQLYGLFGNSIFVMCISSTVSNVLFMVTNVVIKDIGLEGTTVSEI